MDNNKDKKLYNYNLIDEKWYNLFITKSYYQNNIKCNNKTYSIVMPPPNVTGTLTMGHILNVTIQDILIRRAKQHRMKVSWIPGTDHAGIATQLKISNILKKEGKDLKNITKKFFLEKTIEWSNNNKKIILNQLKKIGLLCNWDQEINTLDENYSLIVKKAFIYLYNNGYIYKGKKLVNWCPISQTAISDEEVLGKDEETILYTIKYKLINTKFSKTDYITVSTTRPETLAGDVALAINPKDNRYKFIIENNIKAYNIFSKKIIPIITDDAVDMNYGTGVLKITPAHSIIDFEIGQKHNLPIINVLNKDGTMNHLSGKIFSGLDRFVARKKIIKLLDRISLLEKKDVIKSHIKISYRANVPIEYMLSDQWFLKYPKINEAKKVILDKIINFFPKTWDKVYFNWLNNIKDWCISRQLMWGHKIPVWYKKGCDKNNKNNWVVSIKEPENINEWVQDENVLDTWFSSSLWPLATLGWPNNKNFKKFYPTNILVTGPDIIFFWVARMIMICLELLINNKKDRSLIDNVPFKNVYFTGIIRDHTGKKMSKSLGNSPNPISLIEKYGIDSVRYGIINMISNKKDIIFSEEYLKKGKKFCNKLWNSFRLIEIQKQNYSINLNNLSLKDLFNLLNKLFIDDYDHYILYNLLNCINMYEKKLFKYQFNIALENLNNFFWYIFCDWYLEFNKLVFFKLNNIITIKNKIIIEHIVIRQCLLLLHPFMPCITEEMWEKFKFNNNFIINTEIESYITLKQLINDNMGVLKKHKIEKINILINFITLGRGLKAKCKLSNNNKLTFYLFPNDIFTQYYSSDIDVIIKFLGAKNLIIENNDNILRKLTSKINTPLGVLYLKNNIIKYDTQKINKNMNNLLILINQLKNNLQNINFLKKAPKYVIEKNKKLLEELQLKYKYNQTILNQENNI